MKKLSIIFALLFIVSCGGGGGGGGSAPAPAAPSPIINLSAEPSSVLLNNISTLSWSSSNATSCSASWTTQTSASGSEEVTITTAGNNSYSITCSGAGGSSTRSVTVEGYRNTDGVVVDGYISGAEVCIDENENWTCDSSEPSTTSDNEGRFTLKYNNGNLISVGGTDLDSQILLDNFLITHKLTGHSDFKAVTPVTSVAAFMEDSSLINDVLGIDASFDIFTFDPVVNKGDGGINDYLYEKGNQLTVLAYALQNITNDLNTTTETTQDYFKAISEEIEKEYTDTSQRVNIETEAFISKVVANVVSSKSVTIDDTNKANTISALTSILPVIQVKSDNTNTTAIFNFATSTLQSDAVSIANGSIDSTILNSYQADILSYVANDQSVNADDLVPDITALPDLVATDEDFSVDISVLRNDSYLTTADISINITNPSNGSASINNNVVTYTPDDNFFGSDEIDYTINQNDKTSSSTVSLVINSINDVPTFDNLLSAYSVDENQTAVTSISASDIEDDALTISISGTDESSFNLSSSNVLTFAESPDYETQTNYALVVSVTDGIDTLNKDLTVNLNNLNDNFPVFTSSANFSADENQNSIGVVTATDADGDAVTFSIQGLPAPITDEQYKGLLIDSLTGVMTFNEIGADYEERESISFNVIVSDGLNSITQAVNIAINNLNDNSPVLTSEIDFIIDENTSSVGTITGSDADGDTLSFSISGTDADSISIDSTSGVLSLNETADYETKISYAFNVEISDGLNSITKAATVSINNLNDNSPIFSSEDTFAIDENKSQVGTVIANDADTDSSISYSIDNNVEQRIEVSIAANENGSGNVYVISGVQKKSLNLEVGKTYRFEHSTDHPFRLSTQSDGTHGGGSEFVNGVDTSQQGITLLTVSEDTPGILYYYCSIHAGMGADANSSSNIFPSMNINSSSGELTFSPNPDFETLSSFSAKVSASDGEISTDQNIQVNINDVEPEGPIFSSPAQFSADENQKEIGTVISEDPLGAQVTYSLSGEDKDSLSIGSISGVLSFNESPDYEIKTSYSVNIIAVGTITNSEQNVTISINNLNDNSPSIISTNVFSAEENQTIIGSIVAEDADGDSLSYSVSGSVAEISSDGVLSFINTPDYESDASSYSLSITVSDGDFSDSQDIEVSLINLNDNSPVFTTPASFNINENETALTTIKATDADGNPISFEVTGPDLSISSEGILRFIVAPDYETKSSYSATLTARDTSIDGSNFTTQDITISVINLNDNSPVITSSSSFSVDENQTAITTITAVDADGDNILYSVSGSDLTIGSSSGVLVFTLAPNYEAKSQYSANINVTDNVFSSNQEISIDINDVNDPPRVTVINTFSGPENQKTITGSYSVNDDEGDPYTLALAGENADLFNLSSDNVLSFISDPDYETNSSYSLQILASDSADAEISSTTDFVVNVINTLEGIISMDFDIVDGTDFSSPVFQAEIVLDELMNATKVVVELDCVPIVNTTNCGNSNEYERVSAESSNSSLWTINQTLDSRYNAGSDRVFNPRIRIKTNSEYQASNNNPGETFTHIIYADDISRFNALKTDEPMKSFDSSLSINNPGSDNDFRSIMDTAGNAYDYLVYVESESYGSSCSTIGDGVRLYGLPSEECFLETLEVKDASGSYSYSNGRSITGDEEVELSISLYWGEFVKDSKAQIFTSTALFGGALLKNQSTENVINSREISVTEGVVNQDNPHIVKYTWVFDKGISNSNADSAQNGNFFFNFFAMDYQGNTDSNPFTHPNFLNSSADEFAPNLQSFSLEPVLNESEDRLYLDVSVEVNNDNVSYDDISNTGLYSSSVKDIWFGITFPNCTQQTFYVRDETSSLLPADTKTFTRSLPVLKNLHLEGNYVVDYININDASHKENFYERSQMGDSSGIFPSFTIGDGSAPTCPIFSPSLNNINPQNVEVFEGTIDIAASVEAGADQSSAYSITYAIDEGSLLHPNGMFVIDSSSGKLSFANPAPYIDLECTLADLTCDETKSYNIAVRATIDNKYTTNTYLTSIKLVQDTDFDGIRNSEDEDDDGDGVNDIDDAFPLDSTETVDTDGDGIGNNADEDDDGDGVNDGDDAFPLDSTETVDTDGDGVGNNADADDDNDGVNDDEDSHPLDPNISDGPVVVSNSVYIELRPKAVNGSSITLEGSQKDGKTLTYSIVTGSQFGSIVLDSATGNIDYSTLSKISRLETIIFVANDGTYDSVPGILEIDLRSDPLYKHSWHLDNTGQANFADNGGTSGADLNVDLQVAQGIDGTGVVVSVVDEGLEIAHEDLAPNIIAGRSWDFTDNDNDPTNSDLYGDHGTSVAGIIAADGFNKIGGRGVAPDVGLIGSNFLKYQCSTCEGLSLGYGDHEGYSKNLNDIVDIFNMSYGSYYEGSYGYGGIRPSSFDQEVMSFGTSSLRDSKGALYIKSSGNSWRYDGSYCGPSQSSGDNMPCGNAITDDRHSMPYAIVVGALNANDLRSSYSTPGAALWVAGYGGEYGSSDPAIMTTDQSSCDQGYSRFGASTNDFQGGSNAENLNCNYSSTFNGTSSAAPTVAGVIALMLEANSNLTWRDVKHIIAGTSFQVDSLNQKQLSGVTQYSWVTNAANYKHHPWYGFGRIDALAAINQSKTYIAGTLGTFVDTTNVYVKDVDDTSLVFDITSNIQNEYTFTQSALGESDFIEFITLSLELDHSVVNDIGVSLTSPSGTTISIITPYSAATLNPNNNSFDIGISGFYGEPMNGDWILTITDYSDDSVGGTLKSFTVKTFGN